MNLSPLYWVAGLAPGSLAIMARPRAGDWLEDEISNWRREGVDVVVRLLEFHEVADLDLSAEAELCRGGGIEFLEFPIPDRGVPETGTRFTGLIGGLAARISDGHRIAIHCRAGIGRSSVVAACVMIARGERAGPALAAIQAARGLAVPDTDDQRRWVESFGERWRA